MTESVIETLANNSMSAEPSNERSTIEHMVEKWRLEKREGSKSALCTVFFHCIIGTYSTFAIAVHAVVVAPPITRKYVLLSAHFLLSAYFFVKRIVAQS